MRIFTYAKAFILSNMNETTVSVFLPVSVSQTPSKVELLIHSPAAAVFYMLCPLSDSSHPSPTGQSVAQSLHSAFDVWLWWTSHKMWAGRSSFLALEMGSMGRQRQQKQKWKVQEINGVTETTVDWFFAPQSEQKQNQPVFSSWFMPLDFFFFFLSKSELPSEFD